ncbi:DNA polymerase III subunits gamma and tau [Shigella flexneri CCH060]|uniref:DNA polymerase III subunits gamma and tau n=1 Tax=Shigella flexneri CCH060 TaxID=754091 RepID=A0A6N3R8K3_SHIFL|nr:DNA polymerase III subunits gamma and tau [Escherichia coli DEC9E]EIQ16097.1 DNA polymerase III subunits gamma and tau [Shigella flexneri CCH060]
MLTALANGLSLGRIHHAYLFPVPVASEKPLSPDCWRRG